MVQLITDSLFDKLIKMAPTDKVARLYAGGDNLWKWLWL